MVDEHEYHSFFFPPSIRDHTQGMLSASVALVMYGDYECFQSAKAYRLIKAAQQELSPSFEEKDLCFIFRHFPQIQIYPHAQRAAEAAEAAAVQGQFWQMHEMLFTYQQTLENGYLVEYANRLKLNIPLFLQGLSKGAYVNRINTDIKSGQQSAVEAAPALFINRIRYRNFWSIEHLVKAIIAARNSNAPI
ncbi:DsbA family protein [Aerosakkonemataceae cyanobacterium BLCC-F50]|uniref:DsbA family protein n=1 Tax=Floridaenema flaviceps BLCC-F50 TaxID=3153642 RepID=A0ABV4XT01_9CYAN